MAIIFFAYLDNIRDFKITFLIIEAGVARRERFQSVEEIHGYNIELVDFYEREFYHKN